MSITVTTPINADRGPSSPMGATSGTRSRGAAALVVTSNYAAERRGLTWIAEIGAHGEVAGPDSTLQRQPANAAACAHRGLDPRTLDLVEINEAFAAVEVESTHALGRDPSRVNVNGGAIAIGHPWACLERG